MKNHLKHNTGGRKGARTSDCVIRSISIATEIPYDQVFEDLLTLAKEKQDMPNSKKVFHPYLLNKGWKWKPTMAIGSGCVVHLKADELPKGNIICKLTKHMVAVKDGVINDTYDPSREGKRCVYGYYYQPLISKHMEEKYRITDKLLTHLIVARGLEVNQENAVKVMKQVMTSRRIANTERNMKRNALNTEGEICF